LDSGASVSSSALALEALSLPTPVAMVLPSDWAGPPVSKKNRVILYDSGEWEEFIYEWAHELVPRYVKVHKLAGAGDGSIDVFGMATSQGFEDTWDCFQCKHYDKGLLWSNIFPEMVKIFETVIVNDYQMPRRYVFVSPRGCGTTLSKIINSPTRLKAEFLANLDEWERKKKLKPLLSSQIKTKAEDTDFAIFQDAELSDVLEQHSTSPRHVLRFGAPLPPRPAAEDPPEDVADYETRYVEKLLRVYGEEFGIDDSASLEDVKRDARLLRHFRRQREAFYNAESLRTFARACVLPNTFEHLQEQFFKGVVDAHDAKHDSSMSRLTKVMEVACIIQIGSNILWPKSSMEDRHGICHQLANDDRLTWYQGGSQDGNSDS
jgi:hypothetical protein